MGRVLIIIMKPALFAVSFHHHPMGIAERLRKMEEFERGKRIEFTPHRLNDLKSEISLFSDSVIGGKERELLNDVLDGIKRKMEEGKLNMVQLKREFRENILYKIFSYFVRSDESSVTLKKLSYLTLTVLVCVDYIAAGRIRNGRTKFSEVAEDFYRFYMSGKSSSPRFTQ